MADYIISNEFKTMEEIWDDLLRLHWDYLDTEENLEKLKMRRKLEGENVFNAIEIQYINILFDFIL